MRTRRSTRNQDILFRELFEPQQKPGSTALEIAEHALATLKSNPPINSRTLRQLERDVAREQQRERMRRALGRA